MYSLEEFKKLNSQKKEKTYGPSGDDVLYQKYLESKPQKTWRDEAIERLTPKALTPPTKSGPTYLEKLAENRANAQKLSARVPATASVPDNIRELIFGKPIEAGTVNPRISAADFSARYDSMTDREKAVYSHLKNTNAKDADEYLKAIDMDINQRNSEKRVADARKIAEESTAAGLYARFMGNNVVSNGAASAYELWQGLRNQPVDPNHPLLAGQDIVKGQNEAFVGDSTGIERYLREGAMGAFDFGTNLMTAGAVGLKGQALQNMVKGSFAAQAFAGSAHDAAEREGAGMQSVLTGTASAALATIIEGVGLDRLAEIGKLANARGILKSMARSILPEAAEEAVEEAGNILADAVIMGDKNEIVNLYNTARANGATQNDAMMGALGTAGKRIGESAIIGGISGGMIGGGVAMTNRALGGNVLENDVPDTNAGDTEVVATDTNVGGTQPQNPTTVHETAISDELNNSPAEMRTQPTEAQKKPQTMAVNKKPIENPMTAKFLANEFHGEGRKVVQEKLNETGNTKVIEQAMPFYTGALSGQSFESIRNKYATTATTDYDYAKAVFDAGLADREADVVARMKGRGKFAKSKGVILGDVAITESQMALANYVSKTGGMTVRVVDTMDNYNGEYDRGKNEIVIALDSQHGFAATLFHETVHFIKAANAEGYQKLQDTVFRMAAKLEGKPVEVFMKEYKQNWERNDSRVYGAFDVMEEMTADAMMKIASDENGMKELVNALKDENPTVLEQLKEFLDKLLQALESLVKDGRFAEFTEAIHKDIENTRELRKLFTEELMAAGEYAKANEGDFLSEDSTKNGVIRYSVKSMADAAGLEAKKNPMTGVVSFELNGKPVNEVTAEHIRDNSGLGALIRVAEDAGNITKAEAEIQYKSMAEIMNMIINTQDPDLVWAWVGSSLFSAVKTNSDPQYGTTIDFTTVCRKTQDMITAMSKAMIKLGRGLTTEEVTELQQKLIAEDSAVPCPVCYVFSRWAGVGSILDNMRRWQEKYEGYSEERLQDRIAELTEKLGKGKTKDLRKMLKEQDERYFELEREKEAGAYRKKKLKEARKTADAVGKTSIDEQIKVIDDRAKKIKKELDRIKSSVAPELSWLLNVRTNPGYAKEGKVPNNILFNLDGAATFSEMYPLAWKYRSTRGPGAGKAILPYSDMRLGDMILGVKNNSANGNKLFANAKGELSKEQMAAVEKAVTRTKAQNLIGGQRFQSTSDFRYDYVLDYLLAFMECQALGSKIQTYTKIIEYVDMIAAVGGDVNMSVMPKDKGYVETEDGKKLIFSSVTGIDFEAAKAANEMHDNAQLILVGINDEHIRLALDDFGNTNGEHIGFVIPYHASGASINEFIRVLVGNLGEEFRLENYVDYSDVQTDSERKNATPDQKRRALIRKGILQGRLSGKSWTPGEEELKLIRGKNADISDRSFEELRAVEQKALRGDKAAIKEYESWSAGVLWDVYNKLWANEEHPDFGVRLSSAQAGPVMPHEYWNKGVNRDKAYVNGFIFRSYCYSLGLAPRFTGVGAKGKAHGDFSDSKGYWKTLIDRPMYNNDGTYRDQQKVNVSRFQKEMLTEDYAKANWGDYKVQEPDAKRAERAAEKFVAEKKGKKFSVRENGEAELRRENEDLKKANENLRGIFNVIGRQRIAETSAKEVATAWLKNIGSSYDKDEFARKFKIIAEHMADARNEYEAEDAVEAMKNLAMEAMRKSEEVDTAAWEENKDLYNKVKSTKLFVSDDVAEDLKAYGGYASIVRGTYGKMDLSRKADKGVTDIDVLYGELNAENELLFPYEDGMTKADMLMNIADGMESLQPVMKNKYGYTAEEMAEDVVYDLFDRMGDLTYRTSSLESDLKSNEKYTQLKAEYEKRIAKVRRDSEKKFEEIVEKTRKELDEKWLAERMYNGRKQLEMIAKYQRLKQKNKDNADKRKRSAYRKSAEKALRELLNWMRKPNEKGHVQEAYLPLIEVLTKIDTGRKDIEIKQADVVSIVSKLDKLENEGYASDLTDAVRNIANNFDDYFDDGMHLEDMTTEQMKILRDFIKGIKRIIVDNNKAKAMEQIEMISDLGDDVIDKADKSKNVKATGRVRALVDFFGMELLTPNVFFKGIADSVHENLYKGLRKAHEQKAAMVNEAMTFINEESRLKDRAKWERDKVREFTVSSGQKAYLTIPQIMSLYCHMKREQSKVHIVGGEIKQINGKTRAVQAGGIQIEPYDGRWTGLKNRKAAEAAMKQTERIMVTEEDVKTITDTLTDQQKNLADAVQKFFSTTASGWGNKTSMLMWGYRNFLEPNYFPIESSEDYMVREYGVDADGRPVKQLKNLGFTHNTVTGANNPIIIRDIFSVFATHIDQMASYAAFVPILSDMQKFMNYKQYEQVGVTEKNKPIWKLKTSTKEALKVFMGLKAEGYINDLMRQINMAAGRDDTSSFPVQMTRRMKIAAVGANLRVMAQQPTSIVRAASVMNPLYLLNPANTALPADYRMMYKYAPISLWKKWGGADMDTGRTMKQMLTGGNWYDKTVDISMWGAGALDARTWGRIWKACVQETKANNPKLEGEELYLKAGQRFADVIDETQVVDTPLHRTAIMRKDSALMKMATSFMSEPLKTYNMFFDSARNLYQNPKDAKAYGKFVTTSFVLFLNAVAVSAAAGLVDAMRDDDEDDEFWDKWMKAFKGDYSEVVTKKDFAMAALTSNLGDNMNPVAMIPFVKDVWSIIQGYDVERADVTWMADMVNWAKNMMKFMEGDSKFTMQGMMKNTAENFSKMLGVPAKSLIRELESIENTYVNHIIKVDDADRIEEQIGKKARTHRMGSEENLNYYIEKIVKLHFVGNDDLGASYANKLVESGIDSDKVKDRIDSALKDRCKAEPAAMEAAEAWLAKDYTAMESKLDELQDMGYSGEVAQSAMTSLYNKMVGEDDEPSAEEIKEPFDGDDVDYKKIYRADLKDAYENGGNTERVENQLRSLGLEDKDINDIYRDRISDMFDRANSNGNTTEMERLIDEYVKYNGRESTLRNRIN